MLTAASQVKSQYSHEMADVVGRVAALWPVIEQMLSRTGTAGLTYGIIYKGDIVHTENFGYRDVV